MISLTGKKNRTAAFTLVELLVTVVLVSVTLVITLSSFRLSLKTSDIVQVNLKANNLLRNKMEELEFRMINSVVEDGEAEINDFPEGFSGKQTIKTEADSQLSLITLEISWPKGNKNLSTYVVKKEQAAPAAQE